MRCPHCVKLNITVGSSFCSQEYFKIQWKTHKKNHAIHDAKPGDGNLPLDARSVLSFDPLLATFKVVPNKGEENDTNIPKSLHNAAELFLRAGLVDSAKNLKSSTDKVLSVLSEGPDGKSTHSLGRACICWICGFAGLPQNADKTHNTETTPSGVCAHCNSNEQTNFILSLDSSKKPIPWMEFKSKGTEDVVAAAQSAQATPK
ncbi:hypothetical protein ScalyP_jg10310 [Parmales sp. scaly parma]|nr:hypothetical protein ScalyP_jg10310 [Parmales sp. scaly parma]